MLLIRKRKSTGIPEWHSKDQQDAANWSEARGPSPTLTAYSLKEPRTRFTSSFSSPPFLLPVEAEPTTGTVLPFPRHVPINPSFVFSNLRAQKLLACAYPRSGQVGSLLRSRDRSIESLEYKERREARVEYKAAGAGLALQLEKAPGRKPGESARRGVGGGWKVRLGREVCTVRKFPPSPQRQKAFWCKLSSSPLGARSSVRKSAWTLQIPKAAPLRPR